MIPETARHIYFDLDHTIWDFDGNAARTLSELHNAYDLGRYSVECQDFIDTFNTVNAALWIERRERGLSKSEMRAIRFPRVLEALGVQDNGLALSINEAYVYEGPRKAGLMPHSREVLDGLRQKGYELHVISNGFKQSQLTKIQASDLTSFFSSVTTSEDAMATKPDPKIFQFAMNLSGAKPQTSVYVGDSYALDYLPAHTLGMCSILYDPEGLYADKSDANRITDLRALLV